MRLAAQRILSAAILSLGLTLPAMGQAVLLGERSMAVPSEPRFGGLSAIEVLRDGRSAIVLSDRGTLFGLAFTRTDGQITGIGLTSTNPVRGPNGQGLAEAERDAEGLALLSDGSLAISFEGQPHARVDLYSSGGTLRRALAAVPGAAALPRNGAFEGLAVDRQGRLYTLPESMPGQGPIPLMRFQNGQWVRFAELARSRGWSPVALDIDAQGRLYVLERRSAGASFATRLTRYSVGQTGLGAGQRLLQTRAGTHGNLEGLSVWRDGAGRWVASMVSDDNFTGLLRTTIVEYLLPE